MLPDWLIAVILGVVEGVTEFLPISSTGHLIVVGELVGLPESLKDTFEIVIQLGAVIAVIGYYWRDLWQQAKTVRQSPSVRNLWLAVFVAFLPAAVLGLLLDDIIESVLFAPTPIAIALIVGGIVFLVIERNAHEKPSVDGQTLEHISLRQAVLVGFCQTLALIPGVSRSGASIVGGMLVGLNREVATQFSFYLAIPTLGAATLYVLARNLEMLGSNNLALLALGTVVSGVVAWWSIGWLLRFIATNTFIVFGYYRIVVGLVILLVFAYR